jgi:hypothetical protein
VTIINRCVDSRIKSEYINKLRGRSRPSESGSIVVCGAGTPSRSRTVLNVSRPERQSDSRVRLARGDGRGKLQSVHTHPHSKFKL